MQKYQTRVTAVKKTPIGVAFIFSLLSTPQLSAATLQTSASIENARFSEGSNITNGSLAYSLAGDLTFDNGAFTGIDCYTSNADKNTGLKNGCAFYAGYFTEVGLTQAVTLLATHHDFSRLSEREWGYSELEASWHINQQTTLSASYARDWFNRSIDTFSIKGDVSQNLSQHFSVHLSASIMALENPAPFDSITFAKAGLQYNHQRWTAEAAFIYTDEKLDALLPFDVDQPDFGFTLTYRLY